MFDSLGIRMKAYEHVFRYFLPRRMPLIIRVDGKAFHSYTRGLKPFDQNLLDVMDATAVKLCQEIQGAQLAYVQSDEISILVHDYKRLTSEPWFGKNLQKMTSISAAYASVEFTIHSGKLWNTENDSAHDWLFQKPAYFDSRAFVLPEAEVTNYFIWRQKDWERNSLQMLARMHYGHAALDHKGRQELHDLLHAIGVNWDDLPTHLKRGRVIEKGQLGEGWVVNNNISIFTQDRHFIERHLTVEES